MPKDKPAILYRMLMPDHICPSGVKVKNLLERQGFTVDDRHLTNRAEVDAFKAQHGVKTTPQVFIDEVRIGGFEDVSAHLGQSVAAAEATTYKPVIALFSVAALMACVVSWLAHGSVFSGRTAEWFISISMVLLGLQKLQDVEKFAAMFLNYDLLARRWPGYGYVYPFVETGAGLLMMAGVATSISAPVILFVAGVGAVSVFKAVYLDKRDLKCACVGGDSKVPLGFVSLLENVMMVGMALWMLVRL